MHTALKVLSEISSIPIAPAIKMRIVVSTENHVGPSRLNIQVIKIEYLFNGRGYGP